MFVRWKRRQRSRKHQPTGEWVKAAYLAESVRIQKGPRLKHVRYVGSIREGAEVYEQHRSNFWETAKGNLDKLKLEDAERERIIAALHEVVPWPEELTWCEVNVEAQRWAREEAEARRRLDAAVATITKWKSIAAEYKAEGNLKAAAWFDESAAEEESWVEHYKDLLASTVEERTAWEEKVEALRLRIGEESEASKELEAIEDQIQKYLR
jgi:hypothetical protein